MAVQSRTSAHLNGRGVPTAAGVDDPWDLALRTVVQVAVVAGGFGLRIGFGATLTLALVLALTPVWYPQVRSYPLAVPILALTLVAIAAGLVLAEMSASDHIVNRAIQRASIVHLLNGAALLVSLLWARAHFPLYRVAALYGFGAAVDAILNSPRDWKFDLAVPTTIVVVGLLDRARNRVPSIVVIVLFGFLGILDQGRSFFGFCLAAAGLGIWQMSPRGERRVNRWYPVALMIAVGGAIYGVVSSLLTGGYFGVELQQRSVAQIDATGSLISGGRPEWSATRALMRERPRGYGVGVVPDLHDLSVAKGGLASINVDTGGYLDNYMLGGQFRLHSITSDLWVSFGIVGLVLAGTIMFALVRSLSTLIAEQRSPTVVTFVTILALWHMLFGPIYSNWPDVSSALGLVLIPAAELTRRQSSARARSNGQ